MGSTKTRVARRSVCNVEWASAVIVTLAKTASHTVSLVMQGNTSHRWGSPAASCVMPALRAGMDGRNLASQELSSRTRRRQRAKSAQQASTSHLRSN